MALIRWEPAREISSLQQEMNRLFNSFFEPAASSGGGGDRGAVRRWVPAMDLAETENEFVLRADLPGMDREDVELSLEDDVLTISGERKAEHEERGEGFYRVERASGSFSRSLTLPQGVDGDGIAATFDKGVLEVRIPKPEQRKPRKLQIHVGEQQPAIEGEASEAMTTGAQPAGAAS